MSSIVVVAIHSIGSSTVVVTASERWVSASEVVATASGIKGAAFALASTAGSSVVA
jgi:hypothetical protein